MQHVKADVRTICLGMGMSAAAMILAGGAGEALLPAQRGVMIRQGRRARGTRRHQIAALRSSNAAADGRDHRKHSGRPLQTVLEDIDRDRFMSPQEAVEYGLVDGILEPRKLVGGIASEV
jgi:ATP-dependent Clp protease protease subunit